MKFGWQRLIPTALVWIFALAIVRYLFVVADVRLSTPIRLGVAAAALLLLAALFLWPAKAEEPVPQPQPDFDPFAGGHPVPPMPGQTLPASPRRARQVAGASVTKQSPAQGDPSTEVAGA
jgi:NADH-quinone oxidoreductase subunit H